MERQRGQKHVTWSVSGGQCAARVPAFGGLFYLTIEKMPDGRWEWLVWHSTDPSRTRHGYTFAPESARCSAELAMESFRSAERLPFAAAAS
jgi:hypothetical protein